MSLRHASCCQPVAFPCQAQSAPTPPHQCYTKPPETMVHSNESGVAHSRAPVSLPRSQGCRSGRRRPAETAVNSGQTVKEATFPCGVGTRSRRPRLGFYSSTCKQRGGRDGGGVYRHPGISNSRCCLVRFSSPLLCSTSRDHVDVILNSDVRTLKKELKNS